MPEHKSLGHLLLEKDLLSQEQLNKALAEQKLTGRKIGDILIELNFISEEDITAVLSEQMGLAYMDLRSYQVEPDVLKLVPGNLANRFKLIPLFEVGNNLTVAMADPLNIQAVDELQQQTGFEIQPVFATKSGVEDALKKYYGKSSELEQAFKDIHDAVEDKNPSTTGIQKSMDISTEDMSSEDAPAIKFVNLVMQQAIKDGASDIHVEPMEKSLQIRCRIDGILTPIPAPPLSLKAAIISRLKVLANLDIAEKRLPQDGRVQIKIDKKWIDLRVSTFPTIHGENVVLRILDKSTGILPVEKVGFNPAMQSAILELIRKPNGIILVTGPTGSGKTTTLYSFLSDINQTDKNIMTLEDPVEYQLEGIRQSHVDVKAGLTFQSGLRSILRQDPDVIMIGEIRDIETAEIAIQSALTGHLVFSTLHTNDAASTIARLIDMGIEPFLISSSLAGVLSQRLVRKLCPDCKQPTEVSEAILSRYNLSGDGHYFENKGCDACREGFKGRLAIYELLIPDEKIRSLINEKASAGQILKSAVAEGHRTLVLDGIDKVNQGLTTFTEIFRTV